MILFFLVSYINSDSWSSFLIFIKGIYNENNSKFVKYCLLSIPNIISVGVFSIDKNK